MRPLRGQWCVFSCALFGVSGPHMQPEIATGTKWGANISRKPPNALQGVSSCLPSIVRYGNRLRVYLKHHLPCTLIQHCRPHRGISTDLGFSERFGAHAF